MDKALKQRLVGAFVLVALAVVVLPMLLGGQPESPQDAQPIEIPPRPSEVSFETRRFPIGEQDASQPSVVPEQPEAALDTQAPTEAPVPAATLQERLEQIAAASGNKPTADSDAASGADPAAAVPSLPEPDAVASMPSGVETPPDEAPLLDDTSSAPPPSPVGEADSGTDPAPTTSPPAQAAPPTLAAADGRYLVQVASFSSTANANRLAGTLRESGMPVLMDTVDSAAGILHRVRVGPFAQRAEAEQVVTRLGRQVPDVRPRLVDLRPDEESAVTEPEDPLIRWVVQVGVFSEEANAEKLVFELRDAGFRASAQSERAAGAAIWRVRVGPEVDRAAALALRDRIRAEKGIEGIVQSTD